MSPVLYLIIGVIGGGLIVGVITLLTRDRRGGGVTLTDNPLENELRQQLAQRESDLRQLRSQLSEAGNARAAAEAK
ncbi:MAG: DNA recombination protein RmuC, partial [Verrucomicrobiota bacterium]|nr:DNA recombination protein RmuC [Verrucomicrobiota bacterium]